eukprot:7742242-Pyramimonas_sp.AAC.1
MSSHSDSHSSSITRGRNRNHIHFTHTEITHAQTHSQSSLALLLNAPSLFHLCFPHPSCSASLVSPGRIPAKEDVTE